jgi:hypothetical protein
MQSCASAGFGMRNSQPSPVSATADEPDLHASSDVMESKQKRLQLDAGPYRCTRSTAGRGRSIFRAASFEHDAAPGFR